MNFEDLKLVIPLEVYRKIMAYITLCDLEISGFAEIEYNEERKAFIAGEPYLLKQEVTGTGTHMDEEDVAKFNLEYIKKGGTQLPRLWWHSHVNMQAFFSTIDEDTLKELQNDSFIVALVANKSREMKAKAYIASEVPMLKIAQQIEVDPLNVIIDLTYERIPDVLRKEVEKKVREKEFRNVWKKDENKNKNKGVLFLPKNPNEAKERIEKLGLERKWDFELHSWKWVDPKNNDEWIDYWDSIESYSNNGD